MGDAEFSDPRFDYISEYILKTFKLKPDKWSKLLGSEEYKQVIIDFFDKPDKPQLIVTLTAAGQLEPGYEFPTGGKNKSIYFLKKNKGENIGRDAFKELCCLVIYQAHHLINCLLL